MDVQINDQLPANHQDIDDIPMQVDEMGQEELIQVYERLLTAKEEAEDAIVEIKKAIFDNMKTDSERIGQFVCYYATKRSYPDLTLETAKELGLTKVEEKIDNEKVKQADDNGVPLGEVKVDKIPVIRKAKANEA